MAKNASIGHGSKYSIKHNGSTFTALGEVVNIEGGSDDTDLIDVTHMQSPNRRREFIGGLIECGEITVELNFAPKVSTHQRLVAEQTAETTSEHKGTFADGVTQTFDAIVTVVS